MEQKLDLLLVDDNPIDLVFFGRAANRTLLDIRLQTLTAGQQAIDYLEAKGEYNERCRFPWPDLIVLDLKMPEVNGFDFLAWRKASALFSSIPVIIFSGTLSNQRTWKIGKASFKRFGTLGHKAARFFEPKKSVPESNDNCSWRLRLALPVISYVEGVRFLVAVFAPELSLVVQPMLSSPT